MQQKIKILIADDHAVVRMGLASLFSAKPDLEVVGQAKNGENNQGNGTRQQEIITHIVLD